jgi:hypothetical protein
LWVIVIVISVRPWNAFSKTTTPGLPVAVRATLTAFSTASAPRRQFGEPPADLDVRLVDPDHEALVEVRVDLFVHGRDGGRQPVARVLAAEPAGEIDVRLAVHVFDPGVFRARDDDRRGLDPARHVLLAAGQDALALGPLLHRHETILT